METKLISQENTLTNARFEYTALERNIFYQTLAELKPEHKEGENTIVLSVKDIQANTGVSSSYHEYKRATKNLLSRVYEIEQDNGDFLQVTMFGSCRYRKGTGLMELKLSEDIKPYLFDLKESFTLLQLEVAMAVSSKFSKRMYEILCGWKNFNKGVKEFDLLDLKAMLDLYDPKTKKEQFINWSDFEKRVLKVAEKDLKRVNADIEFTYTPVKVGRKFGKVIFKIKSKDYQKRLEFKEETPAQYKSLLAKGLTPEQADRILENNPIEFVIAKLHKFQLDNLEKKIENPAGWCVKVFGI